jgi:hypothetical protein
MCTAPLQHFLTSDLVKPLFRSFGEEWSATKELLKAVSLLYCSALHAGSMSAKQSLQAPKQLLYIYIYIYIYVVFGPEKLIYIIVHYMSVRIIFTAASKNGVVVVVSIFLRPFFSHFGNKKKSRALSSKGFL